MDFEASIKDIIAKQLEDVSIQKTFNEQIEKGITNALQNLFKSYGDVTQLIEEKIKSVMIPYIESYDYSKYVTKLDHILVEVLKNSALDNKKILENFKSLMVNDLKEKMTITELFDFYKKYVSENVETDGLEVNYEDTPTYQNVDVHFSFEENDSRSWSSMKTGSLIFECDKDEKMNFEIHLNRFDSYNKNEWSVSYMHDHTIKSLRHLNEFDILIMKLAQSYTKIVINTTFDEDSVEVEQRPDIYFK